MKRFVETLSIVCILLTFGAVSGQAAVRWHSTKTIHVGASPLSAAVSKSGQWIYVLTKGGDIRIYRSDGRLDDTIHVGKQITFLAAGASDDQLLVGSRREKTLQSLSLEFIQHIDTAGEPFMGPKGAPVVITVFMDYQCPYCAQLWSVLQEVMDINPKKVRVVFKQFPLKMHPAALTAAAAALAADQGGKFKEMHNLMEEDYRTLNEKKILDKAVSLGFNRAAFKRKLTDRGILEHIEKDIEEGVKVGVRGVPTVFIDGRELKNRSLEGFEEVIGQELARLGGKK